MKKQITVVLFGAGDRADAYAAYSLDHPDDLKVVGLVEPNPERLALMQTKYQVPDAHCYHDIDAFLKDDVFADAVINGTMDRLHVPTSIPILQKGYDMLLEKPFALNETEMNQLVKVANDCGRKVNICHVLRYTPFYSAIKQHILNGEIGDIITIEMDEHVCYSHMGIAFVRGVWRSEEVCGSPMLLAKCCHDIDLMMWMMAETEPASVFSSGNEFQFAHDRKPEGAGTRCMLDCPYNDTCQYSAEANYFNKKLWHNGTFREYTEKNPAITMEEKREIMRTEHPYGRCVWDCDRGGNVDHQAVVVTFRNGAIGTFNLVGGTTRAERNIHILGTRGEIRGTFETAKYTVRRATPNGELDYDTIEYDLNADAIGETVRAHGGGDIGIMRDFVDYMRGNAPSISCTDINDSTRSHLVVFKAEESRKTNLPVQIK